MGVEGSTMVIIGGSSGIGLATATEARRHGASVVIGGRDEEKLHAAAAEIGDVRAVQVDAADPASLASFYASVGPFDHLVIAASGAGAAARLHPCRKTISEADSMPSSGFNGALPRARSRPFPSAAPSRSYPPHRRARAIRVRAAWPPSMAR